MPININFFRSNTARPLDYEELVRFFTESPNFTVYYNDECVEIDYVDTEFGFSYQYLITKKSRVNQIYKLSALYTNVNFLLVLPVLIPEFLAREILNKTQEVCRKFQLEIYHDSFEDVKPFNFVEIIELFKESRQKEIDENGLANKYLFDSEQLNEICKYQRTVDFLKDYYKNEVEVNYVTPLLDKATGEYGVCCDWNLGQAAIFPPHVKYIHIVDEATIEIYVTRDDFYAIVSKYLIPIQGLNLPDLYLLKAKQAKAIARKQIVKISKVALTEYDFTKLRLCDLIDDRK